MKQTSSRQDLQLLEMAAREAGELAMQWFLDPGEVWDKGNNHPVTQADLAVDKKLHQILLGARPDYGWLSEETTDDQSRLSQSRVFVVDPIDGTRAFIKGKPHFSISLAVVENGRPIAGVVFNPALQEMFSATMGQGARMNGKPIRVSKCAEIPDCRMIGHMGLFRAKKWKNPWPVMQTFVPNSMAYRMALVAEGSWDATLTLQPKSDWDLAAADLIASEAGAIVTDPDGHEFRYNLPTTTKSGVICAGRTLFDLIRDRIEQNREHFVFHDQRT
jgi:myo-inositol-1(or 4)-monophosphatase